jgi:hypothetical protein
MATGQFEILPDVIAKDPRSLIGSTLSWRLLLSTSAHGRARHLPAAAHSGV